MSVENDKHKEITLIYIVKGLDRLVALAEQNGLAMVERLRQLRAVCRLEQLQHEGIINKKRADKLADHGSKDPDPLDHRR